MKALEICIRSLTGSLMVFHKLKIKKASWLKDLLYFRISLQQDDTKDGIRPRRPNLQNLPQTKHSSTSVPRPTIGPVESLGIENADATTVAAVVPRVESEHTKSHCQHQPLTKHSNPSSTSNYYHGHQTVSIGCSDAHSTEVAASPRLDSVNGKASALIQYAAKV